MLAYFKNVFTFALLGSVALLAGCAPGSEGGEQSAAAETSGLSKEEALARLKGPFHGDWTMFGVDASGNPKKLYHWTDTVTTTDPAAFADRIAVDATDMMMMDGATSPIPQTWTEGYFLDADGSIGDRFFEQENPRTHEKTVTIEKEVAPNTFTMVQPADPAELASLGFTNAVSGTHVTVKVVTTDGSPRGQVTDSERISRVTTVQWKDATGADRVTQMVTMQGVHQHAHTP